MPPNGYILNHLMDQALTCLKFLCYICHFHTIVFENIPPKCFLHLHVEKPGTNFCKVLRYGYALYLIFVTVLLHLLLSKIAKFLRVQVYVYVNTIFNLHCFKSGRRTITAHTFQKIQREKSASKEDWKVLRTGNSPTYSWLPVLTLYSKQLESTCTPVI